MSTSHADSSRVHPRRRPVISADLPSLVTAAADSSKMSLKKGETFHTPTSPPSNDRGDPVLNIRSLPRRCPTSLEAITASEERMTSILNRLTLDCSEDSNEESSASKEKPTSGNVSNDHADQDPSPRDSRRPSVSQGVKKTQEHGHESDSGLGTSVSSHEDSSDENEQTELPTASPQPPISGSTSTSTFVAGSTEKRQLSLSACKQIEKYMLAPILREPKLKPFHTLVKSIPKRIVNKQIVCLRDLEKTLLWLAPKFSSTRNAYLSFAEFTIQCLHTSASHLNDRDQRLPADRPYTNGYFLDLVSQVRRYAAMIRVSRERAQARAAEDAKDAPKDAPTTTKDDQLSLITGAVLEGGLSKDGKPAQLVVMHEGKRISMLTGRPVDETDASVPTFKRHISFDERVDEGVQRSMARRKKNAPPMDINQKCAHCDKIFKRPCDLTKHEKTHSRPWKCTDATCKYYQLGWPTEKERDRHMNDKHSDAPAMYKCNFQPCTYASKRESNCKQHMEKAHGWVYVRSKNNARGGSKRGSSIQASRTPSVSTPASKSMGFSTPGSGTGPSPSPRPSLFQDPPFNFNDPPVPSDEYNHIFDESPYSASSGMASDIMMPSLNLDSFENQFQSGNPNELIPALEMHRQSMNTMSVPSANSVPDLMNVSGSAYDDSPMAAHSDGFNFDLEWGRLELSDVGNQEYTAMHMSDNVCNQPGAMGMGHAMKDIDGLSPRAQANLMLYSPGSGMEHYDYAQRHPQGSDFTLYGEQNGMNMVQIQPHVAQHQATRHFATSQGMFPPLNEHDHVLQGMQSWPETHQYGNQDAHVSNGLDLEFMK
ncbi:Zinc finger C2H2 [Penicillium angulare]|uniref:Zinc finger C2H2 n=1 Tax=Penicillium angulare TaxID=116970 RepID=UPI00253FDE6A|nr:Zinc finger C2H2 [Penicillium angulare]KAJ5288751.1 Zinc finger C2H2 [Penicillium angulare]